MKVDSVRVPENEEYFDIYIDDKWYGSMRGEKNCHRYAEFIMNYDDIQEKILLEREQAKQEAKRIKDTRVQKELDETPNEDYIKIREVLEKVIAEHPDKEISARQKPNARHWFVGTILKIIKAKPVLVKKVVEMHFGEIDQQL